MTAASNEKTPPDGAGAFRLGVVGAGRMGRTHIAALSSSPDVDVVAVVDPRPEVCATFERDGISTFSDVGALIGAHGVDGVLVAAPTVLHREIIAALAAAGLAVLCEKPCGVTSAQALESVDAAESAGIAFQIAYWRRYVPELVALREKIRSGQLGEILAVHCLQWDESPPPAAFRRQSGGILIDMGVHEFDQIRWLTGQEFATVKSVGAGAVPDDPDCAEVVATLSGGGTAFVSLGRWHPAGDTCSVDVYGTQGTETCRFLTPDGGDAVFRDALCRQAEDFARKVRGETGDGATARDAVAALRAAEAAGAEMTAAEIPPTAKSTTE